MPELRMVTAECMSAFLLLILVTGVHLSPDPDNVFGPEGGRAEFLVTSTKMDYCVLYRVSADGDLLLVNSSRPKGPQPDGYHIKWTCNTGVFHIKMDKLTMSQSGDYRAELGRGGILTEAVSFHLTVCAEGDEVESVEEVIYDDSAVLCRLDSTLLGNRSSVQLYRSDWDKKIPSAQEVSTQTRPWRVPMMTLVLDTNSSLEPLAVDLRGRLHIDFSNSLVTLTGISTRDSDVYCTTWRGAQCQKYSYRVLRISPKNVFAHEQENLTLPCISKRELPEQMSWSTPMGDVQVSMNQTHQQEVMYMLNGSLTGDYSLIIPSVSQQHSGVYDCKGSTQIKTMAMILYVCDKLSSLIMMYYHGESVPLNITEHMNDSWSLVGLQWFRQKVLQPQVLILDSDDESVVVPVDLRDRVTVSKLRSDYSLTISNLTAEDSGLYTWRAIGWDKKKTICSEGTIRLVYKDVFGVDSPFYRAYASLIGCMLLGLVTAVIWFKLRSRTGQQTSRHHQSREGQMSGDEDLYDDVEMAEISV